MTSAGASTAAAPAAGAAGKEGGKERQKDLGANLELGELEDLTTNNDNETSYDVSWKYFFNAE